MKKRFPPAKIINNYWPPVKKPPKWDWGKLFRIVKGYWK